MPLKSEKILNLNRNKSYNIKLFRNYLNMNKICSRNFYLHVLQKRCLLWLNRPEYRLPSLILTKWLVNFLKIYKFDNWSFRKIPFSNFINYHVSYYSDWSSQTDSKSNYRWHSWFAEAKFYLLLYFLYNRIPISSTNFDNTT